MALPMDAGSGGNTRPKGFSILFTLAPTMPGCRRMLPWSSDTLYFSQFLPATMRMESLTLCPEREVPAARKVNGSPFAEATATIRDTSPSSLARITILGVIL